MRKDDLELGKVYEVEMSPRAQKVGQLIAISTNDDEVLFRFAGEGGHSASAITVGDYDILPGVEFDNCEITGYWWMEAEDVVKEVDKDIFTMSKELLDELIEFREFLDDLKEVDKFEEFRDIGIVLQVDDCGGINIRPGRYNDVSFICPQGQGPEIDKLFNMLSEGDRLVLTVARGNEE